MELISFALARRGERGNGMYHFKLDGMSIRFFFVVALFVVMKLCSSFFSKKKNKLDAWVFSTHFFSLPCLHATFRNLQFHKYYFSVSFSFRFCFAWLHCSRFFFWFARAFILTLACVHNRKIVISPSLSIKLIIKHSSCSRQCERIHAQAHTHTHIHRFRWHLTATSHALQQHSLIHIPVSFSFGCDFD